MLDTKGNKEHTTFHISPIPIPLYNLYNKLLYMIYRTREMICDRNDYDARGDPFFVPLVIKAAARDTNGPTAAPP